MSLPQAPIIFLMGPTAAGKTPLAVEIVQQCPCEIISVDSAMVYRGLNIGTAKPEADVLQIAPHRLIDIVEPNQIYSAGQFRTDALREIEAIVAQGKIPLLVGGTMLYFRVLQQGIADLPQANATVRAALQQRAQQEGWETLHAFLATVDPAAAQRIQPRDGQRIQRALEVFMLTGKSMTELQTNATHPLSGYRIHTFALAPTDRAILHSRIAQRFDLMLEMGFEQEVQQLVARGDLTADLPALRSVGYRQMWDYLAGHSSFDTMHHSAIAATRQLAKRQLTWLRSWENIHWLAADAQNVANEAMHLIDKITK